MKAAVLYEANTPLQIVDVEQQGPQAGEARASRPRASASGMGTS
jgi:Zn-dependent alcohol dehydrogenase